MYNNRPYNQFYDVARRAIFPTTNYGRTVIGNYDTFQKLLQKNYDSFMKNGTALIMRIFLLLVMLTSKRFKNT